jgi:hypothetical protein
VVAYGLDLVDLSVTSQTGRAYGNNILYFLANQLSGE